MHRLIRRFLPLMIILAAGGLVAAVFFLRQPLLVVVDGSFEAIYGKSRLKKQQFRIAFDLFRPVRLVSVSEGAGPDLIAIAVKAKSALPYAVLFPYRYEQGAVEYTKGNPDIPVAILSARSRVNQQRSGMSFIRTNSASDYYLAGAAAGLIAAGKTGNILFFHDGNLMSSEREAVTSGIKDAGGTKNPVFLSSGSNYSQWNNVACAIINGAVSDYFEKSQDVPSILFSWADPKYTPSKVKIVFNDSPFAVIPNALKEFMEGNVEVFASSEGIFFPERIEDGELALKLSDLLKHPDLYKKTVSEGKNGR